MSLAMINSRKIMTIPIASPVMKKTEMALIMNNWLQDFAFRIKINAWMFLTVIFLSVLIAWITVGYISVKAAIANPVKSLRSE